MSKFLKALEQAQQETALRRQAATPAPTEAAAPVRSPAAPVHPAPAPVHPAPVHPAPVHQVSTPIHASHAYPPTTARAQAALESHAADGLDEHLVSLLAPMSLEAEQYRSLRHLIEQLHRSTNVAVVAVSSPQAGDGKTTTAINLAGALAQAPDARVLLVDADLRGGSLAVHLGLDDRSIRGLVDASLDTRIGLDTVTHVRTDLNLSIVPAGRLLSAPYEVLKSPRLSALLAEARRRYDYVVVDTPPLVPVPDCRIIEKWVDGFLIVVAAHRTPRKLLEEALHVTEPAKLMGLVFNGDSEHLSKSTYPSRRPTRSQTGLFRRLFGTRRAGWKAASEER